MNKINVVYVFSDEHRYQSISFTEAPEIMTPNMEKLASQGMSFYHCISNHPVCVPARGMLMSGRWPYQTGLIDNSGTLSMDEDCITRSFKDAGYTTGYVGKWHLGVGSACPNVYGIDYARIWSNTNDHWNSFYHINDKKVVVNEYSPIPMTDQALDFIQDYKDNAFFIMLSINPPHADFTDAPDRYKELYDINNLKLRENVNGNNSGSNIFKEMYYGYISHISAVDDQLGRIMDKLDELKIAENTIIIYTADHGSMMGSHNLVNKRYAYSESVKVPFIIRWPGVIPAGTTSDKLLGHIDIMPTILGLAGVKIPNTCVGQDLSPIMLKQDCEAEDTQFIMHISNKKYRRNENISAPYFRGVYCREYTYAVGTEGDWLLFDNINDPMQTRNLIYDANYRHIRDKLRNKLDKWIKKAEDPYFGNSRSFMQTVDIKLSLEERIKKAAVGAALPESFFSIKMTTQQLYDIHNVYEDAFSDKTHIDINKFKQNAQKNLSSEQFAKAFEEARPINNILNEDD